MAENSKIEWTDHTFNPYEGCTKVSPGCKNCYAENRDKRMHGGTHWGPGGTRKMMSESYWQQPLKWNKAAQAEGIRKRVFCASLADVFEGNDTMPQESRLPVWEARLRLFRLIYETQHLDWLLLTKRPENIFYVLSMLMNQAYGVPVMESPFALWLERWLTGVSTPHNIWLGTSVENCQVAQRITDLKRVPAYVRFLSCEPLLAEMDLIHYLTDGGIHWAIAGGESGPQARPSHPDWFRSLRDQCQAAGVPFHFKQWGEYAPVHQIKGGVPMSVALGDDAVWLHRDGTTATGIYQHDGRVTLVRAGKKKTGRLLDGRTWDEFPKPLEGAIR